MKKKLSLLMVALVAIAAFAVQAGRRAATVLIDYPTAQTGITVNGTTQFATVKYKTNTTEIAGIKFANGYTSGAVLGDNWAKLTVEGGFKSGDVVTIAGVFNNTSDEKAAKVDLFTVDAENKPTVLFTSQQYINGKTSDAEITSETYTLTADADVLYLGRAQGLSNPTATYVTLLKVEREEATPEPEPQPAAEPVVIDFTTQNYENAQEVASLTVGDVTVTLDKGTNNNTPKFYNAGTAVRLYGGNTMTVSSAKAIEKIVFTFASGEGTNEITANGGTFATDTWTGSANVVTFTIGGTSGHRRVQKLAVTLAASDEPGGEEPAGEGQVVWTAEEATPIVWDGEAVAIPAEKFAEAKVGDRLRVKLQDAQVYAQVDLRHGAYTLHKPIPCPSFDEVDYVLTGDILNIAKTLGVQFNGIGAKATEVLLVPAEEAAGSMGSIWLPTEAGEGVEMSVDIPAAHFANANNFQGVQVGDVIKIVANDLTTIVLDDLILNADGTAVVKTEENAAELRENGLEITNAGATITEVDLLTPGDIVLDAEPGDLTAAINAAADGLIVGNVTINLKSAGTYTVTEPIVAPANLAITGVEGAIIDASGLNGNLIAAPAGNLTEWQEFTFAVKNVTVKGLKKALFYSAAKNRAYTEFIIDNVVVEQAGDATTIDFTKGGTAEVLTIQNSTFYAPAATTKSFYSSQGGQKTTEYNADAIQTFQLFNSTFVNLARTKNFWSHRQSNQKWMKYDVENNIFVDCGKSGQTIKGLNGGQGGPNPTWIIKRNTFNFTDDNGVLTDTSAAEVTGDEEEPVQESIEGVVQFKDAANGDFHLGEESEQNIAGIGDPRWFTEIQPADIVLTPEDITEGDITAAIAAKQGIHPVGNINITLAADVNYFVTESITADGSVRILGPENGQAVIDAANLNAPLIQMGNTALTEKKAVDGIIVMNVNIKGLKNALFYSAGKNYNIALLSLENDVIELAGDATTIDFTKGSCAMTVSIVKSTVYAPTATTKAFYSSQGGEKAEVYGATEENPQTFSFAQSTFYNLTPGKNFFTHRQNSQKWLKFDAKNNIFVNCGKSGQVIKGMNGGGASANPQFDVEGNAFNFEADGVMTDTGANEETGDADEPVKSFVAGVVSFTDAAAGNFGGSFELGEGATAPELLGDPRWTLEFKTATGISTVKTADQLQQQNVIYNLNGQRVDGAKKGLYIVNGKKVVLK